MKIYYSGQLVQSSGNYCIVDKNGNEYIGLLVNLKEGDIFPPTDKDGQGYVRQ